MKNEVEHLEAVMTALALHSTPLDAVVVCLNNCIDGSAGIVARLQGSLPFEVHPLGLSLSPEQACAGVARRIAMDHGCDLAGLRGIVLTTDADAKVAPNWLAANPAALECGAAAHCTSERGSDNQQHL